jgi:putative transposase
VLKENGFHPRDGHPRTWEQYKSAAKDAIWALDFFFVRTARGAWLQVLLVIDIYTRELIELRAYDGWEADSEWTIAVFAESITREERKPEMVIHDHGTQFLGQFERQLRVLEIEKKRTPTALPFTNGVAERAIKSARFELLNHVRVNDADELQWYLDEYKTFYNEYRPNQAIGGRPPAEYSRDEELAEVIDLAEAKERHLIRHSFAHGLLNAYELVA